ncbi:PEGA domain-containing protein [Candidatus Uhrbacteria bacterium]|nr:PEGA domain-containing protein [Candidatus Uhrbacteria bacterium]
MPATYRRIIFWVFIALFFITAPLLILYTIGYRYNWERGKLQETGVAVLDYRPNNSVLTINAKEQSGKPPARFPGLTPGRYTFTLHKDGYADWTKRLWIEPSKTTFAQHMILWKMDSASRAVSEDMSRIVAASPDQKHIAVVEKKAPALIQFINTRTQKNEASVAIPLSPTSAITTLLWSPRGKRIFVEGSAGEQFTIDMASGTPTALPLARIIPEHLENVSWNSTDDDRLYGYRRAPLVQQGYELVEVDLFRGAVQNASAPFTQQSAYRVEDDLLYRIDNGALVITEFVPSRRALERRLALPDAPATNVTFLANGPDGVITLFDSPHKRLLLIDKETKTLYPIQETIDGVVTAAWSPLHNRLVWSTGKALWLLDLEQSTRELMREEQQKIQDIAWDPENEYVFYGAGDAVNVVEIDNRDNRNRATIATVANRKGLMIGNDGTTIWMTGTQEGKTRLLFFTVTER